MAVTPRTARETDVGRKVGRKKSNVLPLKMCKKKTVHDPHPHTSAGSRYSCPGVRAVQG